MVKKMTRQQQAAARENPWCRFHRLPMQKCGFNRRGVRVWACGPCGLYVTAMVASRRADTSHPWCTRCRQPMQKRGTSGDRKAYRCQSCRANVYAGAARTHRLAKWPCPTCPTGTLRRCGRYVDASGRRWFYFKCRICAARFKRVTAGTPAPTQPKEKTWVDEVTRIACQDVPKSLRADVRQELCLLLLQNQREVMNLKDAVARCLRKIRRTESSRFAHVFTDHSQVSAGLVMQLEG